VLKDQFTYENEEQKKLSEMIKDKLHKYDNREDFLVPIRYERLFDLPLEKDSFEIIAKELEGISR
jgi:hypothetical protein